MEGQKKRRPPVLLLMILVLFLTVGGLALAVQSFGRYDTLLLEQSDSQLYGLARSVDRSVSGALEQFIGELDYLIRLENFTDAEADCLAGQPEELLQLLNQRFKIAHGDSDCRSPEALENTGRLLHDLPPVPV